MITSTRTSDFLGFAPALLPPCTLCIATGRAESENTEASSNSRVRNDRLWFRVRRVIRDCGSLRVLYLEIFVGT
ncbi:hypothetical protein BJY04DRAFT_200817 [Aspergillus karnatakaensis]|uniref:uncharacterized protein n=1 Tax=Aspergillus karnatakaensis TaxID=1810916 RepID=UPI003CCE53D2